MLPSKRAKYDGSVPVATPTSTSGESDSEVDSEVDLSGKEILSEVFLTNTLYF